MGNRKTPASVTALGGIMAALAIVIMSLGGMLGIGTYAAPLLCAVLLQLVRNLCGRRIAWAWFGTVAILSLLLCPDKEAAAVFLFLGYYPMLKPWLDCRRLSLLLKFLYFNLSTGVMYFLLLKIFGLADLGQEFAAMSMILLAVLLVMGNVTFFLLDRLLGMEKFRRIGR